jgi:hypothetical protein
MKHVRVTTFALGAVLASAGGLGDVFAAGADDVICSRGDRVVSAQGAAHDGPSGAKIRELRADTEYVVVATLRHTDGEDWLLLTDSGGGHVGWIAQNAVARDTNPVKCLVPLERVTHPPR